MDDGGFGNFKAKIMQRWLDEEKERALKAEAEVRALREAQGELLDFLAFHQELESR